jgi:hypothetical protein
MAGIQVVPLHDENANPAIFAGKSSLQGPDKHDGGPRSVRKAFGNITNTKPQEPATVKRRAFGDITNSAVKPSRTSISESKEPYAKQISTSPFQDPVQQHHAQQPEKPAGKVWSQQEKDRERREDAYIEKRVKALLSGLFAAPVATLQVSWGQQLPAWSCLMLTGS